MCGLAIGSNKEGDGSSSSKSKEIESDTQIVSIDNTLEHINSRKQDIVETSVVLEKRELVLPSSSENQSHNGPSRVSIPESERVWTSSRHNSRGKKKKRVQGIDHHVTEISS